MSLDREAEIAVTPREFMPLCYLYNMLNIYIITSIITIIYVQKVSISLTEPNRGTGRDAATRVCGAWIPLHPITGTPLHVHPTFGLRHAWDTSCPSTTAGQAICPLPWDSSCLTVLSRFSRFIRTRRHPGVATPGSAA